MSIDFISSSAPSEIFQQSQNSSGISSTSALTGVDDISSEVRAVIHKWETSMRPARAGKYTGSEVSRTAPTDAVASRTANQDTPPSRTSPTQATPARRPGELVTGLKKWVGVIQEIEDGFFTAELSPLDHEGPDLLADFDVNLLAPDDEFVTVGDVVYLTTRYVHDYGNGGRGYNTSTTQIRLRRLGVWSQEELSQIEDQAGRDAAELEKYAE